jgi:hypothetical protein
VGFLEIKSNGLLGSADFLLSSASSLHFFDIFNQQEHIPTASTSSSHSVLSDRYSQEWITKHKEAVGATTVSLCTDAHQWGCHHGLPSLRSNLHDARHFACILRAPDIAICNLFSPTSWARKTLPIQR